MLNYSVSQDTEAKAEIVFRENFQHKYLLEPITRDFFAVDFLLTEIEDGKVLPIQKYVQLKGSAVREDSVVIKTDHIKFWQQLAIPVMICFVYTPSRSIYTIDVDDIDIENSTSKTKLIKFYNENSSFLPSNSQQV